MGVEMKILLIFKGDKPRDSSVVQKLCFDIHSLYLRDVLNPFNESESEPSDDLKAQLMSYLIK